MEQKSGVSAPRSLKEKQRLEREALLLQAAEEMFMEKGCDETSIDEIAARVGIAKGTVYLHFQSKEDLIIAIFLREIQQFTRKVDEIVHTRASAFSRLEAILNYTYNKIFVKKMLFLFNMLNHNATTRQWKEHKETLQASWNTLATTVSEILEQGKAAGEFVGDIPTSVMLNAFFSLLSPRSYERLIIEEKVAANELADYLGRIYFKGITSVQGETR